MLDGTAQNSCVFAVGSQFVGDGRPDWTAGGGDHAEPTGAFVLGHSEIGGQGEPQWVTHPLAEGVSDPDGPIARSGTNNESLPAGIIRPISEEVEHFFYRTLKTNDVVGLSHSYCSSVLLVDRRDRDSLAPRFGWVG